MKKGKTDTARWRVWPKERKTKRAVVKPDAAALELVRCKDCRNLEITGCYGECRKGYLGIVRPDDFCSRGERRRRSERGNELHYDKEMNERRGFLGKWLRSW